MFDLVVKGGTVVDGTGAEPFRADLGVRDGRIVAVERGAIDAVGAGEVIDGTGKVVTPGFIDIHTHYDGQATWDDVLEPSSGHGVTTLVVGNCGVGFAPVRPGTEAWLVQLMEGVEDIPGTALHEGIAWGWETFPEYLDALDARRFSVDIAAYVAHGPVRAYVMGERGARNEPATAADIDAMARIVREAREAGAVGFSTSRTVSHKARDGEPVPGTFAAGDELNGIAAALADGGGGIFEVVPQGFELPPDAFLRELDWMRQLALDYPISVTFVTLQSAQSPDAWREALHTSSRTLAEGGRMYPQIAARPFGMMIGWDGYHFFQKRPTYMALAERLDHEELLRELAKAEVRAAILAEEDLPPDPAIPFDWLGGFFQELIGQTYSIGDPPDYEPGPDCTVVALAQEGGVDPLALAYDLMNGHGGHELLMSPFFNYANGNHDVIYEMLKHPATVAGLGDGGAHVRLICDASMPTYMLTHWARDRRGSKLMLQEAVRLQTSVPADLLGMHDRGVIEVGRRADLNVIDFDRLTLSMCRSVQDLPAGNRRMLQPATGYTATIVNGVVTRREDLDTAARPGRLVRAL
jgi:N-acyl-D-aspartate/D-glutamate deacylase